LLKTVSSKHKWWVQDSSRSVASISGNFVCSYQKFILSWYKSNSNALL